MATVQTRYPYLTSEDAKTPTGIWGWAKRLVDLLNKTFSSSVEVSVEDYGGSTSIADNGPAIQAALDAIHAKGGGTLKFGAGTYRVARSSRVYERTLIRGQGRGATLITGDHVGAVGTDPCDTMRNGSVFYSVFPINASTAAYIHVEDLTLELTNAGSNGACYFDTGGTFITWERVGFSRGLFGLVQDQSELTDADWCEFGAQIAGGAGVWLVNGSTLTPGAAAGYTNRNSFNHCQFNQGANTHGYLDDGGAAHTILDPNFNGGLNSMNVGFVFPLLIFGGEFEAASSNILEIRNACATAIHGGIYAATAGNSSVKGSNGPGILNVLGTPEFSGGAGTKAITGANNFAAIKIDPVVNNTGVDIKDGYAGFVDIDVNTLGFSLSGSVTQYVYINGTKVLGPQQPAIANAVNAAAAPTQAEFNALVAVVNAHLASDRAHGLIHP